jgi:hypothetical protein
MGLEEHQQVFLKSLLQSIITGQFSTYLKGKWTRPFRKLVGIDENEELIFGLKMFVKQEFKGDEALRPKVKEVLEALKETKI